MEDLELVVISDVLHQHMKFKGLVQRCTGISNDEKLKLYKDLLDIEMKLVSATLSVNLRK